MLRKLKNNVLLFFHGLFWGMKKADSELTHSNIDNHIKGVEDVIDENDVMVDLLRGEVTQEVVDFRYRDYAISAKAKEHSDASSGKKQASPASFSFFNNQITSGLSDILNPNKDYRTVKIEYANPVQWNFIKFCESVRVDGNEIFLQFPLIPNMRNFTHKPFVEMLKRVKTTRQAPMGYEQLIKIEFVTNGIVGVKDLLKYEFYDLQLEKVDFSIQNYAIVSYRAQELKVTDLTEKYFSEHQAKLYAENAPKKQKRRRDKISSEIQYCQKCFSIVTDADAQVSKSAFGKVLCQHCMETEILNKQMV